MKNWAIMMASGLKTDVIILIGLGKGSGLSAQMLCENNWENDITPNGSELNFYIFKYMTLAGGVEEIYIYILVGRAGFWNTIVEPARKCQFLPRPGPARPARLWAGPALKFVRPGPARPARSLKEDK